MRVGIHQPHYLPWLRYFEKIARSDVFILLDDVQYEKNGFQNRNKIKTAQGWSYLTVPVAKPTLRPLNEIEIDGRSWAEKHRRAIELSYRKAPYFAEYWPPLDALLQQEWKHLAELNRAMIELFLDQAGIETRIASSTELNVPGEATERLANLCRAVDGTEYLSGAYAVQAYLDPVVLERNGIRLAFQEWKAPQYRQLYPAAGFIPDLAVVDLLYNEGPAARDILLSGGHVSYPEAGADG